MSTIHDKRRPTTRAARQVQSEPQRIEEMADAARWYYKNGVSQATIAERLKRKDASSVTRLLKEARDRGVISFDVDPDFGHMGSVEHAKGRQLRDAFELDHALVVQVDRCDDDAKLHDDYLHKILANRTGQILRERIQPSDHVAVGGGRAAFQTVRSIKRDPPQRKGLRITPLSGRFWPHSWHFGGPTILRPVDADDAAFTLASAFSDEPTTFSQVSLPLFAKSETDAQQTMDDYCPFLPHGRWRGSAPRLAIVGVGVVRPDSGHRLADLMRPGAPQLGEIEVYLKKAAKEIQEALTLSRSELPFFGDVANRLFPALPMPQAVTSTVLERYDRRFEELARRLALLNRRSIVVDWLHLRSISTVCAIAGGEFKRDQLWTLLITLLLNHSSRVITELTTDAETADVLTRAIHAYRNAPAKVKEWYVSMTKRLFTEKT